MSSTRPRRSMIPASGICERRARDSSTSSRRNMRRACSSPRRFECTAQTTFSCGGRVGGAGQDIGDTTTLAHVSPCTRLRVFPCAHVRSTMPSTVSPTPGPRSVPTSTTLFEVSLGTRRGLNFPHDPESLPQYRVCCARPFPAGSGIEDSNPAQDTAFFLPCRLPIIPSGGESSQPLSIFLCVLVWHLGNRRWCVSNTIEAGVASGWIYCHFRSVGR